MKLSQLALSALVTTYSSLSPVSAFAPSAAGRAFVRTPAVVTSATSSLQRQSFSSTTLKMANVLKLTEPAKDLLDGVDVFIFDCDGVIWRGDSVIEGIPDVLDKLRALGKKMFFVTNNSTKSRAGYKKKFDSLGLNVPAEEIFSSSFAAAAYLEQTKFKETGKKAYIIGEIGILEELDLIGVPYLGGPEDKGKVPPMGPGDKLEYDKDVGAVIVGFDRHINYHKIQTAQLCINENEGCEFIATNTDAVTHLTDAQEWAGNGSMVGAIKGCTGKEPTVVGKPSPLMIDYLCDKLGLQRDRICMVGDRLDTDILFGTDNGLKTLLVLSGVTSEEKLLSQENTITPDFYADSINDFFPEEESAPVEIKKFEEFA
uniref:Phosphoglycolate phosphatase n=1 Tax=Helicotheca tamesis TaxID=374047 RepID=A0A7S2E285_9STRA|mmetsp:Transcript_11427/g.15832  ORF Transcript_11427/g.15832 Transcript_11427/m.15832 type:complete len:371 (+) Transcript_11427:139-1251(+)|eukprot:CAMPEP_0185729176 /NCGR_PEP_ID=MMETSP1171-20130828/4507_1 /TAXON_ID=374046 /ORGANISM="Helicotheca tamensis, Strain CCMP826" /LENGTH=370 /DNA_ID=CAMNT_0028397955 /DNA_START=116 /DNA_END=1228 /DNA_ORIENTATION=-